MTQVFELFVAIWFNFYCSFVYGYIGVNDNSLTATEAEAYCLNNFNSHLASIHSQAEHDEVYSICNTLDNSVGKYCLIGLNDKVTEGNWVWSDGTSVVYTNWLNGQPDNYQNNEDCGYIFQSVHESTHRGKWFDCPCIGVNSNSDRQPFICNDPDSCEQNGATKHINWHKLHNMDNNSAQIPYSHFDISLDESTLEMTLSVELEYIGNSSDGDFDIAYNLGTTYVVGFDSFGITGNKINEPGNCQNRISDSFQSGTFDEWWDYSEYPYLTSNDLGSNTYLSYPPPSEYWTLSINLLSCSPIEYYGIFSWNDLTQCQDYNGNDLIHVYDYNENITLSGTLYVTLVSPYSMSTIDSTIYRTFPLIQQDFSISILKPIHVLSSTGIDLFISSIIGIYQDKTSKKYEISVLTQSADYIELISPNIILTPFGGSNSASIASVTTSCLVSSSFTCGQIFTITIDATITCPPADLTGTYDISFTVTCPNGADTDVCNTFLDDNGGSSIALSVDSNFIDNTCDPQTFNIIFGGNMEFYDDSSFLNVHHDVNGNYVIGQDPIYVQIDVNFADDGSGDNYNIFGVEIDNVFVCTANDTVDLTINLDQQNGGGGCLSSNIDADGPYNIITNGVVNSDYSAAIISNGDITSNVVQFSFLTFDIGRKTMYIHTQLTLILQNGSRRRLLLQSSSQTNSNQIRHFIDSTKVINEVTSETHFVTTQKQQTDFVSKLSSITNTIVALLFLIKITLY